MGERVVGVSDFQRFAGVLCQFPTLTQEEELLLESSVVDLGLDNVDAKTPYDFVETAILEQLPPEQRQEYTRQQKATTARQNSSLLTLLPAGHQTLQSLQQTPLNDRAHEARLTMNHLSTVQTRGQVPNAPPPLLFATARTQDTVSLSQQPPTDLPTPQTPQTQPPTPQTPTSQTPQTPTSQTPQTPTSQTPQTNTGMETVRPMSAAIAAATAAAFATTSLPPLSPTTPTLPTLPTSLGISPGASLLAQITTTQQSTSSPPHTPQQMVAPQTQSQPHTETPTTRSTPITPFAQTTPAQSTITPFGTPSSTNLTQSSETLPFPAFHHTPTTTTTTTTTTTQPPYTARTTTHSSQGQRLGTSDVLLLVSLHDFDKHTKTQEFLVAGTQTLSELRDKLYCLEDHILRGPETPSGYFLIEGTFYSDMRKPQAIDYSEEICKSFPEGTFGRARMESTQFLDLKISIGREYIYCHQGDHEHYIVFNCLRFAGPWDEQRLVEYPIQIYQSKLKLRKCCVCDLQVAKYVCYDDPLALETPCFFCDVCFDLLHYDVDGNLLFSDFKVFPYVHD